MCRHPSAVGEAGDVESGSFNWEDGSWEGEEEKSFARYVTNTCP